MMGTYLMRKNMAAVTGMDMRWNWRFLVSWALFGRQDTAARRACLSTFHVDLCVCLLFIFRNIVT